MVDVENPDKYTELKSPFGKFAGYRSIQSFHVLAKTLENKNTIYNDTHSYIHKD